MINLLKNVFSLVKRFLGVAKEVLKKANPFSKYGEDSSVFYIIKKLLAFVAIYLFNAFGMEAAIIISFSAMGYDFLAGEMPDNFFILNLLPLYGFIFFAIGSILYVKIFEKRKLSDIGITFNLKSIWRFVRGMILSIIVLVPIFAVMCALGIYEFKGFGTINVSMFALYFGAFLFQATSEEIMCRGFIMTSIGKRFAKPVAVLFSTITFIAPHLQSMTPFGSEDIISIINLVLVSIFFSILFYKYDTISMCAGFHMGWNFIVSYICGLELSGMTASSESLVNMSVISSNDFLTGGQYGIEGSLIVTAALVLVDLLGVLVLRHHLNKQKAQVEVG